MEERQKRLFLGIKFTPEVRQILAENGKRLERAGKIRLTRPLNYHLTLFFIGNTGREKAIRQALHKLSADAFTLQFAEAGFFRRPEGVLVFQGAELTEELAALERQVKMQMRNIGFSGSDAPYRPHVTLGRRFRPQPSQKLSDILESLAIPPDITVNSLSLFESVRKDGILFYDEIDCVELSKR